MYLLPSLAAEGGKVSVRARRTYHKTLVMFPRATRPNSLDITSGTELVSRASNFGIEDRMPHALLSGPDKATPLFPTCGRHPCGGGQPFVGGKRPSILKPHREMTREERSNRDVLSEQEDE
jgi:hypothetical protein